MMKRFLLIWALCSIAIIFVHSSSVVGAGPATLDEAIKHVKTMERQGAPRREIAKYVTEAVSNRLVMLNNRGNQFSLPADTLKQKKKFFNAWRDNGDMVDQPFSAATWAWENEIAQCNESAFAAFHILAMAYGSTDDIMIVTVGDHNFVVWGDVESLNSSFSRDELKSLKDSYIVDPWDRKSKATKDLKRIWDYHQMKGSGTQVARYPFHRYKDRFEKWLAWSRENPEEYRAWLSGNFVVGKPSSGDGVDNGEKHRLGLITSDGHSVWVTGDGIAWILVDRSKEEEWVRLGERKDVATLFAYHRHAFDRQIDLPQLVNWCTNLHRRFKRLEAAAAARYNALQLKVPENSATGCRKWLIEKHGYENQRLQLLAESQSSRERFTGKYIFSEPKRLRIQADEIYDLLTHTYQLKGRVREKGGDTGIAGVEVEIASAGATQAGRTDTHGKFAVEISRPVVKNRRFSIEISHPDYHPVRVEQSLSRQCADLGNLHLAGKDKPERSVQGLTISPSTKELKVGESVSFAVSARLADGTVETLPDSVVTYTNAPGGRFKAVRAGSFTVTATYRSHSAAAAVTVAEKKPASAEAQQDAPEDAERGSKSGPAQRTAAGGLTIAGPTRAVTGEGVSFTACNGAGDPYTSGSFSWNISREDIMSLQRSGNPVSGSVFKAGKATVMVKHEGRLAFLDLVIEAKVPDIIGLSAGEAQNRIAGAGLVPALRPKDPAPDQKRAYTVYSQEPAPGALRGEGETVAGEIYGKYEPGADGDETGADEAGASPAAAGGFEDAGTHVSSAAGGTRCADHSDCPAGYHCEDGRCVPQKRQESRAGDAALSGEAESGAGRDEEAGREAAGEEASGGGGFQDSGSSVPYDENLTGSDSDHGSQGSGPGGGFSDAGTEIAASAPEPDTGVHSDEDQAEGHSGRNGNPEPDGFQDAGTRISNGEQRADKGSDPAGHRAAPGGGFSDAGTETAASKPESEPEKVTYFNRDWLPRSWNTGSDSRLTRVHIYNTATRLATAAALAKYLDARIDNTIAACLREAVQHMKAANTYSYNPHKAWPDWKQRGHQFLSLADRISQRSLKQRDYLRKGLPDKIKGMANAMARQLESRAMGQATENCDSLFFRIGYHLAYAAQLRLVAGDAAKAGLADRWLRRFNAEARSNARIASRYIRRTRPSSSKAGCMDLTSLGAPLAEGLKFWKDPSGTGLYQAWQKGQTLLTNGMQGHGLAGYWIFTFSRWDWLIDPDRLTPEQKNDPYNQRLIEQDIDFLKNTSTGNVLKTLAENRRFKLPYLEDRHVIRIKKHGHQYIGQVVKSSQGRSKSIIFDSFGKTVFPIGKKVCWFQKTGKNLYKGKVISSKPPGFDGWSYWDYFIALYGNGKIAKLSMFANRIPFEDRWGHLMVRVPQPVSVDQSPTNAQENTDKSFSSGRENKDSIFLNE